MNKEKISIDADIIMGQSPDSSTCNQNGIGIPFLQGCGEFGQLYPEIVNFCTQPRKLVPKDAILISVRAPVGDLNIADRQFVIGRGLAGIIAENINRDFLFYSILQFRRQLDRLSQGSTFKAINRGDLINFCINRFDPKVEEKISEIINSCAAVIEKTEASIAKYEAIKKGMMKDLFTRGIDLKTGKLRPKFQYAPELYKPSEFGMIPKDWSEKKMEEFAEIFYGKDYKLNKQGDDVPIYGTGGIMGYTSDKLTEGPAVLTGRKGSINNPLYVEGNFWNVDTIFCIKTQGENSIKWFYYQMCFKNLLLLNEATGVPSVSSKALYNLKFLVPKEDEQYEIARRLDTISKKINKELITLNKYKKIKSGIMQDLLSGKIQVNAKEELADQD